MGGGRGGSFDEYQLTPVSRATPPAATVTKQLDIAFFNQPPDCGELERLRAHVLPPARGCAAQRCRGLRRKGVAGQPRRSAAPPLLPNPPSPSPAPSLGLACRQLHSMGTL